MLSTSPSNDTNLRPCHPHVGAAVGPVKTASSLDDNLSKLLAKHDLDLCTEQLACQTSSHIYQSHRGFTDRLHHHTHFPVAGMAASRAPAPASTDTGPSIGAQARRPGSHPR